VRVQFVSESKLGATVSKLCKYGDAEVAAAAATLKRAWAAQAAAAKEAAAVKAAAKSERPPSPAKVEVKPAAAKTEVPSGSTSAADATPAAPVHVALTASSSFSVPTRPIRRTGDGTRDMVREKLMECYETGKEANAAYLREQAVDTASMAEDTEEHMHTVFNGTSKDYKARFRSLMFNLRDAKNPEFIRSVMTGSLFTNDLATMNVREMASDEAKKRRQLAAEHAKMALMDEAGGRHPQVPALQVDEDGVRRGADALGRRAHHQEVHLQRLRLSMEVLLTEGASARLAILGIERERRRERAAGARGLNAHRPTASSRPVRCALHALCE
jgi:hypothetical protein